MNEEQIKALLKYIDAVIALRVAQAMSSHETHGHGEYGDSCGAEEIAKDLARIELYRVLLTK